MTMDFLPAFTEVLTSDDIQSIKEELFDARTRWFDLGAALRLDNETLKAINKANDDCSECLREMLAHLLQTQPKSITWKRLCEEGLKNPTVRRNDIAEKIEQEYSVKGSSVGGTCKKEADFYEDSRKRKRLDSDAQLCNDLESIQLKFGELTSSFIDSLERREIKPKTIASRLLICCPGSMAVEDESILLRDQCKELRAADTIDDIVMQISEFVSFLDYDLLGFIIKKFGDENDKNNLARYIEDLKKFLSSWKEEPYTIIQDGSCTENEVKMTFKLETDSMKRYREVKRSIAKIFEASVYDIRIIEVNVGCIEISFLFPKIVVEQSLPLSSSQKDQLEALNPPVLRVCLMPGGGQLERAVLFEKNKPDAVSDPVHTKTDEFQSKRQKMSSVSDVSLKLLAACRSESPDITVIRGYLEQEECDVNIREDDEFKWTSFMWCLENKHFEIAKLLLKYQPRVDIQDKKEWSPLILASRAGDLEIVQGIVALGAEINKPSNTLWTPLMWAAQEGHVKVAEFLLRRGAQVDFPDENGWTPLMQASQEGYVDVVNVLLDHKANINHQTNTAWCALMAAAKNMHPKVVDALLKRGAVVDLARNDGSTALQVASYYKGNSAVVNVLIKHGANVDIENKDGMTALILATSRGHLDLVQSLINGGADINKQHPKTGWSAIFFAVRIGNMDIFKELLQKGAETEISLGGTVASVANFFGHTHILFEFNKYQASQKKTEPSHPADHKATSRPEPKAVSETNTKARVAFTDIKQSKADQKNSNISQQAEFIRLVLENFAKSQADSKSPCNSFLHSRKGLPFLQDFSYQEHSRSSDQTHWGQLCY